MLLGLVGVVVILLLWSRLAELHFQIPKPDGSVAEVTVEPLRDGTIHIKTRDRSVDQNVEVQRFLSRTDIRPKIVPSHLPVLGLVALLVLYVALPVVAMCITLSERRKWRRLRRQIGLDYGSG